MKIKRKKRYLLFWWLVVVALLLWLPMAIGFLIAFLLKKITLESAMGKLGFVKPLSIYQKPSATAKNAGEYQKLNVREFMPDSTVWIHVASFGEWNTLAVFLKELRKTNVTFSKRIIVTTVNDDLQKNAETNGLEGVESLLFFPIENPLALRSMVKKYNVACVVVAELELWPLSLLALSAMGLPLFMVNAGLFKRETDIYGVFQWLFRPTLRGFTKIYPATQRSYQNFVSLGVHKEILAEPSSFKVDIALQGRKAATEKKISSGGRNTSRKNLLKNEKLFLTDLVASIATDKKNWIKSNETQNSENIKPRPMVLFGSVHVEEIVMLKAFFVTAKNDIFFRNQPDSTPLIIIAPRYFLGSAAKRWDKLLLKLQRMGFVVAKRSNSKKLPRNVDVVLLDSFGEMTDFFPLAKVVVMGGAFATLGGHNLLEPLAAGKKVVTGAHLHHFLDVVENFGNFIDVLFGTKRSCGKQLAVFVSQRLRKKENLSDKVMRGEIEKKMKALQGASKKVVASIVEHF